MKKLVSLFSLFATVSMAEVPEANKALFKALPDQVENPNNKFTQEKIDLGRMLYYDTRLSKNQEISCNSCHQLNKYGVDGLAFSPGHKGQLGGRSSPSTYNAALHIAQFWDGREPDVESQAKGPVLNPVEMAMPSEKAVVNVLKSIPDYKKHFEAAFPESRNDAITYDNMAKAIGAFERKLLTPAPVDAFLKGDDKALTAAQKAGMNKFIEVGCATCHNGPAVGGNTYIKLGLVSEWPLSKDPGRESSGQKGWFKVASLRNITETAPYSHNGAVKTLPQMVDMMAKHQLGRQLGQEDIDSIVEFLGALKGEIPHEYIKKPVLPESGPNTPKPDHN